MRLVAEKVKKGQELLCLKLAFCPDHPRRHSPPEIYHAGSCPGISYIFQVS